MLLRSSSSHRKLIFLKFLLYLIMFCLFYVLINKILINYKKITTLSKEKICIWFNQTYGQKYVLNIENFKLSIKNLNIYINIQGLDLSSKNLDSSDDQLKNFINNNYESVLKIKLGAFQAKVNIISMLLFGNIKINNFIVNDILFTFNHLYTNQHLDELSGSINVKFTNKENLNLQLMANLNLEQLNLDVNFQINELNNFKFNLSHKNINIRKLLKYLPERFINKKLISWLDSALLSGNVKLVDFFLYSDHSFYLNIKFEDVLFNYAKNWPSVEHLSANLKIINNYLEINMVPTNASLLPSVLHQPIKLLKAKLNLKDNKPLAVEVQIKDSLVSKGIEFFTKTNLLKEFGDALSVLFTQGNMDLNLILLIPLEFNHNNNNQEKSVEYLGEIKLNKANLKILDLSIYNVSTNIKFSNNYIATDSLTGKIFDIPIVTNFLLEKDLLIVNNSLFNLKAIVKNNFSTNFFKLKSIDIFIKELNILDNLFENIKLENTKDILSLVFDDNNAKGQFNIIYDKNINDNQLNFDFDKLKFKTRNVFSNNYYNYNALLYLIKNINFNCNKLYFNDIYLGSINFNLGKNLTSLESNVNQLEINNFKFSTNSMNSNFTGSINFKDINKVNTIIHGSINSINFGSGLRELNIDTKFIANGNGYINFNLSSLTDPFTIDLYKIIGKFNININSGFILGLDPGFGRIIGLFNIENIQRRILLDFSDVTNQGFSFDKLTGEIELNNGELTINKILVNGPSANILINGNTSLFNKKLDLFMEVTNKVGTTLPLAAAVAVGNPAIGAAVWLFDYASGAKFSQFKSAKYKINGTWNKPEIQILKNAN